MPPPRKRRKNRSIKLEELKLRLAEAVETLEAIRSGSVDALVVHGPNGEQVFTLKGADQVYRTLVEAMNEGAVSLSSDQTVIYCNTRFSEFIKTPLEKIIGAPISSFAALRARQPLAQFLKESTTERGTCETVLLAADSAEVAAHLSANPVTIGDDTGISLVVTDITERKQLEVAQRELARRIVVTQEQERHRISRELHDGINQLLSSARHRLHGIEKTLRTVAPRAALREIGRTREVLERTIDEVRRISRNLRPSELDDFGLASALESLIDDFQKRTQVKVKARNRLKRSVLNKDAELAVYRVVQEALNNIERHSRASEINLSLQENGGALHVRIKDDGCGFDMRQSENGGFGLANMKERATHTGGNLWWNSAPGKGTEVCLVLPL